MIRRISKHIFLACFVLVHEEPKPPDNTLSRHLYTFPADSWYLIHASLAALSPISNRHFWCQLECGTAVWKAVAARLDFGLTRGRKMSPASLNRSVLFLARTSAMVSLPWIAFFCPGKGWRFSVPEMANVFGFGWFWYVLVKVVAHAHHARVLDVSPSFL